jgi:hypothetical protein
MVLSLLFYQTLFSISLSHMVSAKSATSISLTLSYSK